MRVIFRLLEIIEEIIFLELMTELDITRKTRKTRETFVDDAVRYCEKG